MSSQKTEKSEKAESATVPTARSGNTGRINIYAELGALFNFLESMDDDQLDNDTIRDYNKVLEMFDDDPLVGGSIPVLYSMFMPMASADISTTRIFQACVRRYWKAHCAHLCAIADIAKTGKLSVQDGRELTDMAMVSRRLSSLSFALSE